MGGEGVAIGQSGVIAEELQATGIVSLGEHLEEQAPEQP